MHWYGGEILDAINVSKTQKSLFVVFVEAENATEEQDNVWKDENISKIATENKCVCLKLKAGSQLAKQFSQIYPVIVHPTTYFIGLNGQPLEVRVGNPRIEDLIESFNTALELHESQQPSTGEDANQAASDVPSASSDSANIGIPVESKSEINNESSPPGKTNNEEQDTAAGGLTLEERTEEAKRRLARLSAEKTAEITETEKDEELERRKLGQEMKKLKDFQEEMKRKELEKELKIKKVEAQQVKEEVRRQIELDREERAKKYQDMKMAQEKVESEKKILKEAAEKDKQHTENANKMDHAKIQFRLPDGSSLNNTFPSLDLFSTARSFILQKLSSACSDVTLSTIHPKKTFEAEDYNKTFLGLNLAPSAVLVVLPKKSTLTTAASTGDGNVIIYFFTQILLVFQFLISFIFPSRSTSIESSNDGTLQDHPEPIRSSDNAAENFGGARPKVYPSQNQGRGLRNRREGNIHRLTADDPDDEQATWNGNSTQQM